MTREFCTYFDHRYLPRGLALYRSLERHCPDFRLWVLCLSDACGEILSRLALPRIRAVPLSELERFDPELRATRGNRSLIEYYFTCSPCLPRLVLATDAAVGEITYLDSDLWFFSDPTPVFEEIGARSVAIIPHRFSPNIRRKFEKFGEYNVGWLTFRRDRPGLACLEWWRERCLEWCHDQPEPERYADQKYLERFATLGPGVAVISHKGANLAPWNIASHAIEFVDGRLTADGDPLVFFHFQGVHRVSERLYDCNLVAYRARMSETIRKHVYAPYVRELAAITREVAPMMPAEIQSERLRKKASALARARNAIGRSVRLGIALGTGNTIAV